MELGEQIKMRMKAKGISQNELARRAGMSSSGMSTIINGSYDPRLSSLRAIAAELECTVADLLGETSTNIHTNQSEPEREMLDAWRMCEPVWRQVALDVLHSHAQEKSAAS